MKKIILIIYAVFSCFLLSCCGNGQPNSSILRNDKIYFFYQTNCIHCHHAAEYIDQKYPDLDIIRVNIANKNGMEMLMKCAKKFKLGDRIGTPLFCMGDKHLMGWGDEYKRRFDFYVQRFIK